MGNKLLIGLCTLLCCTMAQAQYGSVSGRAYDPNAPKHTVSGSVVNAVTGEPIARALVQLMGPLQRSDLTDAQGSFRFEGVPEGRAFFVARKPGFLSSEELLRGGGRPRSPIMISADVSSLVLKLTPEGIVTGMVSGDDGEPLENAQVHLKRQVISNGRKQWETRSQSRTDDNGEFRAANLVPGTYYVVAEAQRAATARAAEPNIGYAPSYYPGTPDLASASTIEVRGGQTAQIEFRLRSQPVYEVKGVVTGLTPGERGANIEFINRSGDTLTANARFNPDDGSFSARLPAGTYTVRAKAFDGRGSGASTTITVAANLSGIRLPLVAGATIPVIVKTEFSNQQVAPASARGELRFSSGTDSLTSYASVQLIAVDFASRGASSDFDPKDSNSPQAPHNVEPGRYTAQISPHGPWYVASATYGQADLLREDMVVTAGSDLRPMEIVLRDDGGTVAGPVTSDNNAVPAVVLVIPEHRLTTPQAQYASERGLTINSLAPGDYLLFAFDSIEGLEYTNREALEPYASRATHVTVNSKGSANVMLTLIKRGEP